MQLTGNPCPFLGDRLGCTSVAVNGEGGVFAGDALVGRVATEEDPAGDGRGADERGEEDPVAHGRRLLRVDGGQRDDRDRTTTHAGIIQPRAYRVPEERAMIKPSMNEPSSAIQCSTVWLISITATAARRGTSGRLRRARKLDAKKIATATPAPWSSGNSPLKSTSAT